MTSALRLRRRTLLEADFSSSDEGNILGVQESERWFDTGYERVPVLDPFTSVEVDLNELLTSLPLTAYTTGSRTRMPTLALNNIAVSGRETMPTLVTTIEPTNGTGA